MRYTELDPYSVGQYLYTAVFCDSCVFPPTICVGRARPAGAGCGCLLVGAESKNSGPDCSSMAGRFWVLKAKPPDPRFSLLPCSRVPGRGLGYWRAVSWVSTVQPPDQGLPVIQCSRVPGNMLAALWLCMAPHHFPPAAGWRLDPAVFSGIQFFLRSTFVG